MTPRFPLTFATLAFMLFSGVFAQEAEAEVRALEAAVGSKFHFEESKNFIWALEMSSAQAKPLVDTGERAMATWQEMTGEDSWRGLFGARKALIVCTKDRRSYMRFLAWYEKTHPVGWSGFQDVASAGEFFVMPAPRVAAMFHLKPRPLEEAPGVVAHEIGRLLAMRHAFHNNFLPPWLEEGFGLWLEAKVTGRNVTFTFGEAYGAKDLAKDKLTGITWASWKAIVRDMATKRKDAAMKAILPKRMSELGADNTGKAWSVIDYLIQKDAKAFPKYLQLMKRYWPRVMKPEWDPKHGEAQAKALQEAYGLTMETLDTEWRNFIQKEYKPSGKR